MGNLDYQLLLLINGLAFKSWWLDQVAIFFAIYIQYILVGIVLIYLVLGGTDKAERRKNKLMVLFATISVLIARLAIGSTIHHFYFKLRPFAVYPDKINLLINYTQRSGSFPSGHTLFFFAMATSVYFFHKKTGIFLLIAAFFIALARVYVGVHYPIDILAGAIIGILVGCFVDRIGNIFWPREISLRD